jgi:hypothetical protein
MFTSFSILFGNTISQEVHASSVWQSCGGPTAQMITASLLYPKNIHLLHPKNIR